MTEMGAPRFWRNIQQRYRMTGTRCGNCDTSYFPPRQLCPSCRREGEIEELELDGSGTVVTHTTVHEPSSEYDGASPYDLAVVELDEGPRVTAQVTDDVEIGDEVEACFRRMGEGGGDGVIYYGYKFQKAD